MKGCYVKLRAATTDDMRPTKKLEPLSIRLDPDVRTALESLAAADDRTLSAYVHRLLKQHVERERAKAERKGS